MKKKILLTGLFVITAFGSFVSALLIFDSSAEPDSFVKLNIDSKVLGEKRDLIVHLPNGYDPSKAYPTVYVIGGNSLTFKIAYDTDVMTYAGFFKPCIVVGIPNSSNKTRNRDLTPNGMRRELDKGKQLTGEADKYLTFIEKEVMERIDKTYATSSEKILVGHSRAGMTVMYSLIKKPDLFTGRICLSPAFWREDHKFVHMVEAYLLNNKLPPSTLFMSMGQKEVDKMKLAFDEMIALLSNMNQPSLDWKARYTPNADHASNPKHSAVLGLKMSLNNAP